jgi:hypothetical protein
MKVSGGATDPGAFTGSNFNALYAGTPTGLASVTGVNIVDSAPGSYNGYNFIVNSLGVGTEDYRIVDNVYNIAFNGIDQSASFDPDLDIEGEAITLGTILVQTGRLTLMVHLSPKFMPRKVMV